MCMCDIINDFGCVDEVLVLKNTVICILLYRYVFTLLIGTINVHIFFMYNTYTEITNTL